jgi:hypothetical protein
MIYFTIEELIKSSTARRKGIPNLPNGEQKENLIALVDNVLDPLRKLWGKPIIVTSGFRCAKLNRAVGGVAKSQHTKGQAADIRTVENTTMANKQLFDVAMRSGLPFDQLIDEYGYNWIHISFNTKGNRKQVLHLK